MCGNGWERRIRRFPLIRFRKKDKTLRLAKGGGWTSPPERATIDYRNAVDGAMKNPTFGFRCVKQVR